MLPESHFPLRHRHDQAPPRRRRRPFLFFQIAGQKGRVQSFERAVVVVQKTLLHVRHRRRHRGGLPPSLSFQQRRLAAFQQTARAPHVPPQQQQLAPKQLRFRRRPRGPPLEGLLGQYLTLFEDLGHEQFGGVPEGALRTPPAAACAEFQFQAQQHQRRPHFEAHGSACEHGFGGGLALLEFPHVQQEEALVEVQRVSLRNRQLRLHALHRGSRAEPLVRVEELSVLARHRQRVGGHRDHHSEVRPAATTAGGRRRRLLLLLLAVLSACFGRRGLRFLRFLRTHRHLPRAREKNERVRGHGGDVSHIHPGRLHSLHVDKILGTEALPPAFVGHARRVNRHVRRSNRRRRPRCHPRGRRCVQGLLFASSELQGPRLLVLVFVLLAPVVAVCAFRNHDLRKERGDE
mmetsp:Transcript_12035/g.23846  ORF Transcript_12035/g.23846 Transcript_12035/m.23846 type:complete len:404 (+) Transcript_12035:1216-2427(+)